MENSPSLQSSVGRLCAIRPSENSLKAIARRLDIAQNCLNFSEVKILDLPSQALHDLTKNFQLWFASESTPSPDSYADFLFLHVFIFSFSNIFMVRFFFDWKLIDVEKASLIQVVCT